MKVLLLNGSANRKGNTFTALSEIAKQLEKKLKFKWRLILLRKWIFLQKELNILQNNEYSYKIIQDINVQNVQNAQKMQLKCLPVQI